MLNGLLKKNPNRVAADDSKYLTHETLDDEVSNFLQDKPAALFNSEGMQSGGAIQLSELVDKSTRLLPTFLAAVVLPTVLTLLYLVIFATPQFETDQSFTVQQGTRSQRSLSGVMALAAQFSGISTTSQETYMVLTYLRSTNAIQDIGGSAFLESLYGRDDIDYMSRLERGLPLEEVHRYWQEKIIPELDTRSGIVNLKVRAFSSADAYAIATKLMALSEKLVNEVSQKSRDETLQRVEGDVKRSTELLAKSRAELLAFRNSEKSVDPVQDAGQITKILTDLTLQRIQIEVEIGSLITQVSSDSPTLKVKREEAASIQKQISDMESRMTGLSVGNESIAGKLVQYEKLKTDLMYYEKLYTTSLSTYEQAREDTIKQQIFVIPIISPNVSESSHYPKKFEVSASVFLFCFALWAIVSLAIAAIKDHRI